MSVRKVAVRAAMLGIAAVLVLALASCGSKDLVSLAKLDKGEITIKDRFGNSVKVPDPASLLTAIKGAKPANDSTAQQVANPEQASYILSAGAGDLYYDWDNNYLFYVSGNKKTVYSLDLKAFLLGIPGLPPRIAVGPGNDPKISGSFPELAKVPLPSAALFKSGDKGLLLVAAGEQPTGGYSMELEKVSVKDGSLSITVRLRSPSGTPPAGVSYPYLELSIAKYMPVEVSVVRATSTGDRTDRANTATVPQDGNVVLYKPDRGSLLTERVRVYGFARIPSDSSLRIHVEDGHYVLGAYNVSIAKPAPSWSYFDFNMDLAQATNPSGMVIATRATSGKTVTELEVPVAFGGK